MAYFLFRKARFFFSFDKLSFFAYISMINNILFLFMRAMIFFLHEKWVFWSLFFISNLPYSCHMVGFLYAKVKLFGKKPHKRPPKHPKRLRTKKWMFLTKATPLRQMTKIHPFSKTHRYQAFRYYICILHHENRVNKRKKLYNIYPQKNIVLFTFYSTYMFTYFYIFI